VDWLDFTVQIGDGVRLAKALGWMLNRVGVQPTLGFFQSAPSASNIAIEVFDTPIQRLI